MDDSGGPREALRWSEHGATCWRQYRNTGDLEALNYCVLASRLAVAALPDTHVPYGSGLSAAARLPVVSNPGGH